MHMDIEQALSRLQKEAPAPVYLVRGTERYLTEHFIKQLRNRLLCGADPELAALNVQRFDDDQMSLAEILAAARQMPMFVPRRLVVAQADMWFGPNAHRLSDVDEMLLTEYLSAPAATSCLVFVCKQTDRRRQVVKQLENAAVVVECMSLTLKEAPGWVIQRAKEYGFRMQPAAAQLLVSLAGTDLERLSSELEKLMAYAGDSGVIEEHHISTMVGRSSPVRIFDLLDSVARRQVERSLVELTRLLDQGDPPLMVLAMLTRQARNLLQFLLLRQQGLTPAEIQRKLGIHPFVMRKLQSQINHWSRSDATAALLQCIETETAIKTGRLDPEPGLQLLVTRLAGRLTQPIH